MAASLSGATWVIRAWTMKSPLAFGEKSSACATPPARAVAAMAERISVFIIYPQKWRLSNFRRDVCLEEYEALDLDLDQFLKTRSLGRSPLAYRSGDRRPGRPGERRDARPPSR